MSYGTSYKGFAYPKGQTARDAREARQDERERQDRDGSDEVRRRSGGRCELPGCGRRATEVHHLLGGNGRRGRACEDSHRARNKVHLCAHDHRDVHDKRIRLWWRDITNRFGSLVVDR